MPTLSALADAWTHAWKKVLGKRVLNTAHLKFGMVVRSWDFLAESWVTSNRKLMETCICQHLDVHPR